MDHLPYPQHAAFPPLSVPYYPKYTFDGGDFTGYPTRCDFDKSQFVWGDFSSIPVEDHTAFAQAWLFFGVIHTVLGAPAQEFIDASTNRITTARLPHWSMKLRQTVPSVSQYRQADVAVRVHTCLREVCEAVSFLDDRARREDGRCNVREDVAFSIVVLGITLEQAIQKVNWLTLVGGKDLQLLEYKMSIPWPTTEFVRKRLDAARWCPSESGRLQAYMKATGIYYSASMEQIGKVVDHSHCSPTLCTAEDVDEAAYTTAHAEGCNHGRTASGLLNRACEHVGPALSDVVAILERDRIPVLALIPDASGVRLEVVPSGRSTPYTALSHVWADGMGNPVANTLPQCQINRIYELVTSLNATRGKRTIGDLFHSKRQPSETVYVWLDTLLIPLEKRLRKIAISRMYDTYRKAKNVFVLDKSLMSVPSDRPSEEIGFRLAAAPWMRRAWTLQEGALAHHLYVQLQGAVVNLAEIGETIASRWNRSEPYNIILEESINVLGNLASLLDADKSQRQDKVQYYLAQRSTSHPEDKEICFAVMLQMDMKHVMEAEGDRRTLCIVKQLSHIPRSFLWPPKRQVQCLEIPGYTWLPKNIITTAGISEFGLRLTADGLMVVGEGLIYRGRSHYMRRWGTYVRDASVGKWYSVRWQEREEFTAASLDLDHEWSVLAALPGDKFLSNPIFDAVILQLDWILETPSPQELYERIAKQTVVKGRFVGRAVLEHLDGDTTATIQGSLDLSNRALADARRALQTGEATLDGFQEGEKSIMVEVDDDSWCVFDGKMLPSAQQWLVA